MWWWVKAAAAFGVLALAGCGFKPLYGDPGRTGGVQTSLQQIIVDPITDRLGHSLRQDIADRLTPRGEPSLARYHLMVKISEVQDGEGIRSDLTYARINYRLTASWQLKDETADKVVIQGSSTAFTSYDVGANPFATVTSENDGRERAAKEVADDIQMRLAVYFESQGKIK